MSIYTYIYIYIERENNMYIYFDVCLFRLYVLDLCLLHTILPSIDIVYISYVAIYN